MSFFIDLLFNTSPITILADALIVTIIVAMGAVLYVEFFYIETK